MTRVGMSGPGAGRWVPASYMDGPRAILGLGLALFLFATACVGPEPPMARDTPRVGASAATPMPTTTAAPTATVVPKTPTPPEGVETVTATPAATPTSTFEPTATPVPELSVRPAQALSISTKGTLIRIAPIDGAYFTLEGDLFEKLKSLPHVSHVERYLVVELGAMESNDAIIGVEPGSPLRIVRGGDEVTATVYTGETFEGVEADGNLVIAGKVKSEAGHGMGGMVHEFLVGQTFTISGFPERIRVIGKYRSKLESQDFNLFLPIETAQTAFDKEGKLSYLFISVDSPDNVARVEEDLRGLL